MKKDIEILKNNTNALLKESTSTINITDDILDEDAWVDRLIDWAEKNEIDEVLFPRNKEEILALEEFDFGDGGDETIPKEILNLQNITSITIVDNKLITNDVWDIILQMTSLNQVYIYNTNISCIPNDIDKLTNLTELTCAFSKIKTLPSSIYEMQNLELLDLFQSDIEVEIDKEKFLAMLERGVCTILPKNEFLKYFSKEEYRKYGYQVEEENEA